MKPTVIIITVLTVAVVGFLIWRKYKTPTISTSTSAGYNPTPADGSLPPDPTGAQYSSTAADGTTFTTGNPALTQDEATVQNFMLSPYYPLAQADEAQLIASTPGGNPFASYTDEVNWFVQRINYYIQNPGAIGQAGLASIVKISAGGSNVDTSQLTASGQTQAQAAAGAAAEAYVNASGAVRGSISGALPAGSINAPANANAGQKYQAAIKAGYTKDQASALASLDTASLNIPAFANYFLTQIAAGLTIPQAVSSTHGLI